MEDIGKAVWLEDIGKAFWFVADRITNKHPWSNFWKNTRGNCQCVKCELVADVGFVTDIADHTNKKTFLFYTFSGTEVEYEISLGINAKGPEVGAKQKIKTGDAMVLMVEPHYKEDEHHTYYCIYCYEKLALENKAEMAHLQTILMNCRNKAVLISKGRLVSPEAYKDY